MIEFLLCITYFTIFCFLIRKLPLFKDIHVNNYWFISIYGIKVIVGIILTLIYTNYYTDRSTADIYKYFDDSKIIFDALSINPIDYIKMMLGFDSESITNNYYHKMAHWTRPFTADLVSDTHLIIRFNALVRLFSFGHFQVHNIFINFISLVGLSYIYKAFKPFLVDKEKVLFYILFIVPSILFWGSGVLKESFILLAIGLILYYSFHFTKQNIFKPSLLILIGILLLIYTKLYIFIALAIPIFGYLLNHVFKIKKSIYGYLTSLITFVILVNLLPIIDNRFDLVFQIANKQQDFSRFVAEIATNSSFILPELNNGYSLLKNIPNALLNTTIRPFPWECNSIFIYLSALENILVLLVTGVTIFFRKKINSRQKNILFFNLTFVFLLFSLIGLTTPVFGAIMRYKIPGSILLLLSLLLLADLEKIKTKNSFLNKIL